MVKFIMKRLPVLFTGSLIVLSAVSCSNLSKNHVRDGKFIVRNGTFADKRWDENLEFRRISWYHELTLQFDFMMTSLTPQSSFNFWFSQAELVDAQNCDDFRVALAYSLDTRSIPYSQLNEQLERSGFKKVELLEFKKHLLQHPDSEMNSTRLYQVYGLCRSSKDAKPLTLNFPGFNETTLN